MPDLTTRGRTVASGIRWDWSAALRGAVLAAPAVAVATHDLGRAAVLAVGLVPAVSVPLPATRRARLLPSALGVLTGLCLLLGAVLAVRPPTAVLGIFLVAVGASRLATRRPSLGTLVLNLFLPVAGIGLSFGDDRHAAAGAAVVMTLGSLWALAVALAWPAGTPRDRPPRRQPTRDELVRFGYLAGAAGALCAAIGFALDLEHVGWATGAALLVMRPAPRVQQMRSVARVVDVTVGAAVAIALVTLDAPVWLTATVLGLAVVGATATAGSRWYVLPVFTTFLVLLLLLADGPGQAGHRFWERVLETVLGVGVAAVFSFVVPRLLDRPERARMGP